MILNKLLLYSITITTLFGSCSVYDLENSEPTPTTSTSENSELRIATEVVNDIHIKSIIFKPEAWKLATPVVRLGSKEKFLLRFDDLSEANRRFSYSVFKCDKDWRITNEALLSFTEGFINNQLDRFEFSHNTLIPYKHYQKSIPDDNYTFTKSGNYILMVYDVENEKEVIFSRRFQIVEPLCGIEPTVRKSSIISDADYRQEIDFAITVPSKVINPHRDLEVHLFKNGNRLNTSTQLKPVFMENNRLTYDYDEGNVFDGGNEFRSFNLQSLRYNAEGVAHIEKDGQQLFVSLIEDKPRTYAKYFNKDDLNGKFIINNQDREPSELSSEYMHVNFTLKFQQFMPDGDFYIFGELSNWQLLDEFKLEYDLTNKHYQKSILLKQGFYDYQYVYVNRQLGTIDEAFIEGTHFQTQNEYTIQVFWLNPTTLQHDLIGSHTFLAH